MRSITRRRKHLACFMDTGQGLASLSLALQPSHLCNPSLTDLGPNPKNIFSLRAHSKPCAFSGLVSKPSSQMEEDGEVKGETPKDHGPASNGRRSPPAPFPPAAPAPLYDPCSRGRHWRCWRCQDARLRQRNRPSKVKHSRVYFSTAYFQISSLVWQPFFTNIPAACLAPTLFDF